MPLFFDTPDEGVERSGFDPRTACDRAVLDLYGNTGSAPNLLAPGILRHVEYADPLRPTRGTLYVDLAGGATVELVLGELGLRGQFWRYLSFSAPATRLVIEASMLPNTRHRMCAIQRDKNGVVVGYWGTTFQTPL